MDEDPFFRLTDTPSTQTIIRQFVIDVVDFSSQYGNDNFISYTAANIIGVPSVYPYHEDNMRSFLLRTYGPWWTNLPSTDLVRLHTMAPADCLVLSEDFIDILYEKKVYPVSINIYETYNPGAIVKIFCYCYETRRWELLWQERPEVVPHKSRIFCPKLKSVDFKTDYLRLEFYHRHLQYYYALDAVLLAGIQNVPPSESSGPHDFLPSLSSGVETLNLKSQNSISEKSAQLCYFGCLPFEVMHLIISHLDLGSLCAASKVSRLFKKLCYDPMLYKVLDMKPYWPKVDAFTLRGLLSRSSSLQRLNLSWCGGQGRLTPPSLIFFLENSHHVLTCLKLSNCRFIDNDCLKAIAASCPLLQALELRSCRQKELNHLGFSHIAQMMNLTFLDLYRTLIDKYSILQIIRSCLKLEHLFLGSCLNIHNYNDIAREIAWNLRNIKTLDLWRAKTLTHLGVVWIAEHCRDLIELDLGWCIQVEANNGSIRQLIRNCTKLRKIVFTAMRTISDAELVMISSSSKELEQLDILGTREITAAAVQGVLQSCKKLKLLDVSYCQNISKNAYEYLQVHFPRVEIRRAIHRDH